MATMIPTRNEYFGVGSPWYEACKAYERRDLPDEVVQESERMGGSRISYCLGYGFARACHARGWEIPDLELQDIAGKLSGTEFVAGFRRFKL